MKKLVAGVVATTVLVTGCGSSTSDTSNATDETGASTQENQETVDVRFAIWAGGKELNEFNAIVDEVNSEANGEYNIIVESIPDNYNVKLSTQFAGGNAADLIWLSQEDIPAFSELGALYDITELNNATTNETLKTSNYYENIIDTAMYDDKLYGLPWIANPVIMYYNTALFEKYGVELPAADENGVIGNTPDWTYDKFIETAQQFPNNSEEGIYGWITAGWPPLEMYIWAEGGDILDEEGNSVIASTESINGLNLAKDLLSAGITQDVQTVNDVGFSENFLAGNIAMIMAGAADDYELRDKTGFTTDDLAYGVVPAGSLGTHPTFNWTASTVMNANTENPEIAYKAMEAMTMKFFEWKVAPPIKDGIDRVDTMLEGTKIPVKPTMEAALKEARSANYDTHYNEYDTWNNLYSPLLLDSANFNSEEAATKLDEKIKQIQNR